MENSATLETLTAEQRKEALQRVVSSYILQGYHIVSQADFTAQLLKPKRIHPLFAILMLLFIVGGWVILLIYYFTITDKVISLRVDEYGRVFDIKDEQRRLALEARARQRAEEYSHLAGLLSETPSIPFLRDTAGRKIVFVGASILFVSAFFEWPSAQARVLVLVVGSLLLLGSLLVSSQPGEPYSLMCSIMTGLTALFIMVTYLSGASSPILLAGLAGSLLGVIGGFLKSPEVSGIESGTD